MSAQLVDEFDSQPARKSGRSQHLEKLDLVTGIERNSRTIEAQRHRLHVEIAGPTPQDHLSADGQVKIRDIKVDEIAALLRWSPEWARRQINISRALVNRLPGILNRLEAGEISAYNAVIAAEGVQELFTKSREDIHDLRSGNELAQRYESLVAPKAEGKTVGEMRKAVRKAVIALAPLPADELHELACLNRRVDMTLAPDGMCWVNAYLPSVEGQRVMNAINGLIDRSQHFTGTEAQNRADAFVSLMCNSTGEAGGGTGAEVQVLVSLETLLGVSNEAATVQGSGDLMTAGAIRALAEDSRLRRIVYDPVSKQILEFGRETYRPPAALRDHVIARDQVCRYPGCGRHSVKNDLDHVKPWEDGGRTDQDNLVSLCRRHHNLKTHAGWTYTLEPDDSVKWVSPSGVRLVDPPRPITD